MEISKQSELHLPERESEKLKSVHELIHKCYLPMHVFFGCTDCSKYQPYESLSNTAKSHLKILFADLVRLIDAVAEIKASFTQECNAQFAVVHNGPIIWGSESYISWHEMAVSFYERFINQYERRLTAAISIKKQKAKNKLGKPC